jgi:PAS domain S-box-containing protein
MMARILVVDDEKNIRITLREFLRDAGHEVSVAESAEEALGVLQENEINVVVSDIIMPRITGLELLKSIKMASPYTQVILLTGEPTVETAAEAVRAGAFDYQAKPFRKEDLLRTVASAVKLNAAENEALRLAAENLLYKENLERLVEERTSALRESEARYRAVVEDQTELICRNLPDFTLTFVNESYCRFFTRTREELVGRSFMDLIPEEEQTKVQEYFASLGPRNLVASHEHNVVAPNGEIRSMKWTNRAILDAAGAVVEFQGTGRDVTDQRLAELEARRNERLLNAFFDASPAGLLILNRELQYVKVNETLAETNGVSVQDHLGKSISQVLPELAPTIEPMFRGVIDSGQSILALEVDGETPKKPGAQRSWVVSYFPIKDQDCGDMALGGVVIEVTERKRAEEHEAELEQQLLQAQKLESLGTLAGGIAHDFNNILHVILGFSKIATEHLNGKDEVMAQCLDEIDAGGRRAADLVNQILTFSRRTGVDINPLDLPPLIEEALRFIRSTIPTTIRIDSTIDPGCARVAADAAQIHQVTTNLCTNAMHAMEDGGGTLHVVLNPISVDSSLETLTGRLDAGKYIQLSVTDTGTGIDPEKMDQILDPFFTTKGVGKGTGLGLPVVHGIVKGMNGGLTIESELGIGTTVRLILPVFRESGARQQPRKPLQSNIRGYGHVMIVDDEEAIRKFSTLLLESRGFTVEAFSDATSALSAAKNNSGKFDVAILDYTMPGKTGLELAKELESLIPDMPVILATGLMNKSNLEHRKSENIISILKKPIEAEDLIAAINRTH